MPHADPRISCPLQQGFRLLLLTLWIATIFWLSLDPAPPQMPGVLGWDKLLHALAYGLLAWLIAWVLVGCRNGLNHHAWWQSFLLACLFGAVLEILQMMMQNGRTAEWGDLLADAIGALIACVIFRQAWGLYRPEHRQKRAADG